MIKSKIYSYLILILILFLGWFFSTSNEKKEDFSEHIKVSLRTVGDQLLHSNKDSTTLVLPVLELTASKYRLSFEQELSFMPNDLVKIVKESFTKAKLPEHYRVSVVQKSDGEVAYSYEMSDNEENTIIPCSGRNLPRNQYAIEVLFMDTTVSNKTKQLLLILLLLSVGAFLLDWVYSKNKRSLKPLKKDEHYLDIGSFKFYPEQNKLVKAAQEIGLSKKECELLSIFIAKPNEIIKRDELIKKVWEDNGVFVGRSLDTFISKLRKKLKDDTSIKLTNIHGVGYKLEVE